MSKYVLIKAMSHYRKFLKVQTLSHWIFGKIVILDLVLIFYGYQISIIVISHFNITTDSEWRW